LWIERDFFASAQTRQYFNTIAKSVPHTQLAQA